MCPFLRQFKERFLFYFKFFCFVLRCMKLIIYIYIYVGEIFVCDLLFYEEKNHYWIWIWVG